MSAGEKDKLQACRSSMLIAGGPGGQCVLMACLAGRCARAGRHDNALAAESGAMY